MVSLPYDHCLTVSCICQCRNESKGGGRGKREEVVPLQNRQIICCVAKGWGLNHKHYALDYF